MKGLAAKIPWNNANKMSYLARDRSLLVLLSPLHRIVTDLISSDCRVEGLKCIIINEATSQKTFAKPFLTECPNLSIAFSYKTLSIKLINYTYLIYLFISLTSNCATLSFA